MKITKLFITIFFVSIISIIAIYAYQKLTHQNNIKWYQTEKPEKRTIRHEIYTSGILEIKNNMKIGSQLQGIIKEILVKENQRVIKGTILAIVETQKNDKDILSAQQNLKKAEQEFYYQQENFKRRHELYKTDQLSKNEYERIKTNYEIARAELNTKKIELDKTKLEYEYTNIMAPDDGIVTAIYATKGIAVYADFTYILFEIAHDISQMKATLDIDESEIGYVKPGQRVKLTVNTYPDQPIYESINDISFIPKSDNPTNKDSARFYKATIDINNKDMRLRPGMVVTAKMIVEEAKNVLSISGLTFQYDWNTLEKITKIIKYAFKPLTESQKNTFEQMYNDKKIKYVWTIEDKTFTQKPIVLGITDNNYWQIIEGLIEKDAIVNNIYETDEMEKLYKSMFKGLL